jgi:glycosyltransferase involved in cell wall biosynthesis
VRIALLSEKYPPDPGGLAISSQRLARQLACAGHEVRVWSAAGDGADSLTQRDGLEVRRLPQLRRADDTLAEWFNLLRADWQARPVDVVHVYFITSLAFVATYAARTLGLPVIVSARGNDLDRVVFDPAKAAHTLAALQQATIVTTNSRDLQRKAQALLPARTVEWVPNGVDAQLFRPAPRDEQLAHTLALTGRDVIGFVGEARVKKGLAALLIAYQTVARTRPVVLLIVGGVRRDDKELLKVFQKQCPDLPVVLVPYTTPEALPAYYHLIDVLALPSLRDGLPNALLEGMACECAIVGSRVGGIPDALVDGENGRLAPPGDAEALAQALDELLADADLRRRLGRAARASVLCDFTVEQEVGKNLALYRQVLESKDLFSLR